MSKRYATIKEYIDLLIKEDMDVGPGGSLLTTDDLKSLVKPFTDVFDTAVAGLKQLAPDLVAGAKVALDVVLTTYIPILESEYEEIFHDRDKKVAELRQQYKSIYDANWDAIKNSDAALLAFMYDPGTFLASPLVQKAPAAAEKLASLAGVPFKKKRYESLIREDEQKSQSLMSKNAKIVTRSFLKNAYDLAKELTSISDINELSAKLGGKAKELKTLDSDPQLEKQALSAVKSAVKDALVKNLTDDLSEVLSAGIPKSSMYVKDYEHVINAIKAL